MKTYIKIILTIIILAILGYLLYTQFFTLPKLGPEPQPNLLILEQAQQGCMISCSSQNTGEYCFNKIQIKDETEEKTCYDLEKEGLIRPCQAENVKCEP